MSPNFVINSQKKLTFSGITILCFGILLFQFFKLQILNRESYFQKSEQNRIREIVVKPARGLMFDRDENLLVDNRPTFSVSVIPYEVRKVKSVLPFLQNHFRLDDRFVRDRITQSGFGFSPIKLISQIEFEQLSLLEENKLDLPGVLYQVEPRRNYSAGIHAAHVFGYTGEISERQVESLSENGYEAGDIVGTQGLERIYENYLRGKKGYKYVQVDALGRTIEENSLNQRTIPPQRGLNLLLTLSSPIQKLLEELLEGKMGAAVVLDPRSGEILAMVSKPDFDPSLFTQVMSANEWNTIANHPDKLLLNRALAGEYPAGSTFKLVSAIAALNDKVITSDWSRTCSGGLHFGSRVFSCFRGTAHGTLNLLQAIERSCNIYFYQLMYQRIGLPRWSKYAHMLHFGGKTGIDLPGEKTGYIPTEASLDKVYGKSKWPKGLLLNMAIGQGEVLVTPLQMACLMMIIGNEGIFHSPHLVRSVEDVTSGEWKPLTIQTEKLSLISLETFRIVKEGMYRVVNGDRGTGRIARIPWISVCGKTGTAQNPHGKDHGWFVGFAPKENPQIAWAIIVESGGTGGSSAAPIAHRVLQQVFGSQPPDAVQAANQTEEEETEGL